MISTFAATVSRPSSPDKAPHVRRVSRPATDRAQSYKELLRRAGLRPTRQRMALVSLLFANGHCHATAEILFEEALAAGIPVSLGTVYNTLNQLTEAGLLRRIGVDGSKSFFDTNLSDHHHFYVEGSGMLFDIPATETLLVQVPDAPDGFGVSCVEVVIRLRRKHG